MAALPIGILFIWLSGLLAFGLVGGGAYALRVWYLRSWVYDPVLDQTLFLPGIGVNGHTALLGGVLVRLCMSLLHPTQAGDTPRRTHSQDVERIERPDGVRLHVECYGPTDGQPIIAIHGWGTDSTEWYYLKQHLSQHHRLIVWDLPGISRSTRSKTHDYSLEAFADSLRAVLALAGDRPAVLVGHSIGGMTVLTFCRLFPELLGTHVARLVLVHTTFTNPVRTTTLAGLFTALERPLLVPLLHLTIWLSPLVLLMNWMSYLNGTLHLANRQTGFGGTEPWAQVDFASQYSLYLSPGILARGMLGMLRYDATEALGRIPIPTLVVPGNRDPMCRPEASERIAHDVPHARLVALAPAKHMGFFEHHEHFAALVNEVASSAAADAATSAQTLLEAQIAQPTH